MSNPAYEALANLATLSRSSARGLPAQTEVAPRWSGVGFSVLGKDYVIPMGQVKELMEVPVSTKLPGVQSWVVGLSNVRGRLLPLIDLAKFLGGSLNSNRRGHRVLVLETDNIYSGLIVDRSYGMQHLLNDTFHDAASDETIPYSATAFVTGAYRGQTGNSWTVFDLNLLAEDSGFSNAAQ